MASGLDEQIVPVCLIVFHTLCTFAPETSIPAVLFTWLLRDPTNLVRLVRQDFALGLQKQNNVNHAQRKQTSKFGLCFVQRFGFKVSLCPEMVEWVTEASLVLKSVVALKAEVFSLALFICEVAHSSPPQLLV